MSKNKPTGPAPKRTSSQKKAVRDDTKNNKPNKSAFVNKEQFNNYEEPMPEKRKKYVRAKARKVTPVRQEVSDPAEEKISQAEETVVKPAEEIDPNHREITITIGKNIYEEEEQKEKEEKEELPHEDETEGTKQQEDVREDNEETSEQVDDKEESTSDKEEIKDNDNSDVKEVPPKAEPASAEIKDDLVEEPNEPSAKKPLIFAKIVHREENRPYGRKPELGKKKIKRSDGKPKDDIINIDEVRQARQREKRKKNLKRFAAAGAVLIVGLTVYLTRNIWAPKLEGILDRPHSTIVNDGKTEKGNFPIELDNSADNKFVDFGNYIIDVDKDHILMYDEKGRKENSFTHHYASPRVETAKKRILVYDDGAKSFRVLTGKKEVYSKTLDRTILMAKIARNENVMVVTRSDKMENHVTVYDGNGTEIYSIACGKVVNAAFCNDGDGCYISSFSSEKGEIVSKITKLDFSRSDTNVFYDKLPTLVLDIFKVSDNSLWVVGDTHLYRISSKGEILVDYEYPTKLTGYALGEKGTAVVYKGIGESKEDIAFFKSDSGDNTPNKIVSSNTGTGKKFKYADDKFVMLKNDALEAYDFSGNLLATAKVAPDYCDFVIINKNAYFQSKSAINKIAFKTD